jgi:hypothetical protein
MPAEARKSRVPVARRPVSRVRREAAPARPQAPALREDRAREGVNRLVEIGGRYAVLWGVGPDGSCGAVSLGLERAEAEEHMDWALGPQSE